MESLVLGFGILNNAQGIRNPNSTNKESRILYLESGIQNPRRGIQNPRLSWIPLHGTIGKLILEIKSFTKVNSMNLLVASFFLNYMINAGIREVLEMSAQLCGWMSIYVASLGT